MVENWPRLVQLLPYALAILVSMEPLFIQRESHVLRTVRKSPSLRTTIPAQVAEFLKVTPGDKLQWTVKILDNRTSVFVSRMEVPEQE